MQIKKMVRILSIGPQSLLFLELQNLLSKVDVFPESHGCRGHEPDVDVVGLRGPQPRPDTAAEACPVYKKKEN